MLPLVTVRLCATATAPLRLTRYKGSTFRGLFKTALREAVCVRKQQRHNDEACSSCIAEPACVYARLTVHRGADGQLTPQPYVIDTGAMPSACAEGENVSFDITLFGPAIDALPMVLLSADRWRRHDLGRFQPFRTRTESQGGLHGVTGRVEYAGAFYIHGGEMTAVHQPGGRLIAPVPESLPSYDALAGDQRLRIRFQTPTRLFAHGKRVTPEQVSPEVLLRTAMRRVTGLADHFGSMEALPDRDDALNLISGAVMVANQLKAVELRRYRSRNTKFSHYDGLLGEVVLGDVPATAAWWLRCCNRCHIGKYPTMGLGKIDVSFE